MSDIKGRTLRRGTCGKGVYDSEDAALRGIAQRNRVLKRQGQPPIQLRPYHCPTCGAWHLTRRRATAYWNTRRTTGDRP